MSDDFQACLKMHPIIALDFEGRKYETLLISRPEDVMRLLKTETDSFEKVDTLFNAILGKGNLVVSNGELWRSQHELFKHIFSSKTFAYRMQVLNEATSQWVDALLAHNKTNGPIDLYESVHQLSLKAIFKLIFKQSITDEFANNFILLRTELMSFKDKYAKIT